MLFSKLSEKERVAITNYISAYAGYGETSVDGTFAPLEKRLSVWNRDKQTLFDIFGGQLILEKEVEYHKANEELSSEIYDKVYDATTDSGKFYDYMCSIYPRYSEEYYTVRDLFDTWGLARNCFDGNKRELPLPNGHILQVVNGAKPIKTLGKLAKAQGEDAYEMFEKFRLEHSQILNTKGVKGTLCLSIHPLDFMTMSDNCSDWSSCMSWTEGGSYRRGTVEMMNSPMVVVGYLRSNETYRPCQDCNWNDKRWRSLFVVRDDIIVSVKGYPYMHEELARTCVSWLRELAEKNKGWKYHEEVKQILYCDRKEHFGTTIKLEPHARGAMYNDFGCTIHYGVLKDYGENPPDFIHLDFNYCGESTCMCCGDIDAYYSEEGYLCCSNCQDSDYYEESYYCEECDCRVYEDDVYWVDGDAYCPNCIDRVAETCALSGEWTYKEHLATVYLASTKDHPDAENDFSIRIEKRFLTSGLTLGYLGNQFHGVYPHESTENKEVIYYWNTEELSVDAIGRYFGLWSANDIARYTKQI